MSISAEQIMAWADMVIEFLRNLAQNNWSLFSGILIGVIVYGIWSNARALIGILAIGVIITVLTNMGIIPPINVIFEEVKALAGF